MSGLLLCLMQEFARPWHGRVEALLHQVHLPFAELNIQFYLGISLHVLADEPPQELLGHQSLSSTQVYTHLTSQRMRDAYDKAHPRAEAS